MEMPTQAQLAAFGRHLLSYGAGAATAAAAFNLISSGQAMVITTSLQHIGNGVSEIAVGVAPLVSLATGLFAAWTASHKSLVEAVAAIPGTTVVTTPQLAAATPDHPNIVSNKENAVVEKPPATSDVVTPTVGAKTKA